MIVAHSLMSLAATFGFMLVIVLAFCAVLEVLVPNKKAATSPRKEAAAAPARESEV